MPRHWTGTHWQHFKEFQPGMPLHPDEKKDAPTEKEPAPEITPEEGQPEPETEKKREVKKKRFW